MALADPTIPGLSPPNPAVVTPTTILRRTMALPTCPPEHVSQLGIDDWSFRRGRKFGTILVDLTTHKVIDLLPDRTTETARAWMQAHPEIDIVSRDRGGDYAAAARTGAPQAKQVADRFHLAQNLTDRIEVILSRCCPEIRKALQGCAPSAFTEDGSEGNERKPTQETNQCPSAPDPLAGNAHLAHRDERADRLQQLSELRAQGVPQKEIAHRLGMGERTVRDFLTRGIPYGTPESRNKRRKGFDPYASYIEERIRQGCRNGQELWREITAQGYKGSCRTVYRFLESRQVNTSSIQGKANYHKPNLRPQFNTFPRKRRSGCLCAILAI